MKQKRMINLYEKRLEKAIPIVLDLAEKSLVVGKEDYFEHFKTIAPYFQTFGFSTHDFTNRYELVGLLKVEDMKSHGYYSTGTTSSLDAELETGYVSAWLIETNQTNKPQNYLYDTGCPKFDEIIEKEYQTCIYFLGRDDGSFAKFFKSREAALEFIKKNPTLDQILTDNYATEILRELGYGKSRNPDPISDEDLKSMLEINIYAVN